jgi:hypothetical protein
MGGLFPLASLAYITSSCFYFFCHSKLTNAYLKFILKITPLLVMVTLIMNLFTAEQDHKEFPPFYYPRLNYTLWSLLFSIIGNAYATGDRFIYQLISFTAAHYFKFIAFTYDGELLFSVGMAEMITFAFLNVLSLIMYRLYMLPKFYGTAAVIIYVYTLSVTMVLWGAVINVQLRGLLYMSTYSIVGAVGACLHYISDVTLCCTNKGQNEASIVLITYYSAIFVITSSFILF